MTEKVTEDIAKEAVKESIPGGNVEEKLVDKSDYYMVYLCVGNWLVLLLFMPSFAAYTAPDTAILSSIVLNFVFWAMWMKFAVRRLRALFIFGLTIIMFVAPVLVFSSAL